MDIPKIILSEISFSDPPTKTQMVNALRDIHRFLSKAGGAVAASGDYAVSDQPVQLLFSAAVHCKVSADAFENGPNAQGLATPQPGPMQVRR